MKLSDILGNYYVMTMGNIVGFHWPDESDEDKAVNINFNVDGQEYDQYFNDQEVEIQEGLPVGNFVVIDVDGLACEFTALNGAPLS